MPETASRKELKAVRHRLLGAVARARKLAGWCLTQVADGDLRRVDRESAEKRYWLATKTAKELEYSLARVEEHL